MASGWTMHQRAVREAGRELCGQQSIKCIRCPSHQETCQTNIAVSCTWMARGKYFKSRWNIIITLLCENNSKIIMK